jgi:hypothetical protein
MIWSVMKHAWGRSQVYIEFWPKTLEEKDRSMEG